MYEPRYLPRLNSSILDCKDVKFGIVFSDRFIDVQDPDRDPLHLHKQLEIFFNVDSNISFFVRDRLYSVPPGSAVIIPENELHICVFNESRVHFYYCLWIGGDLSQQLPEFFKNGGSPLITFDERSFARLAGELKELHTLYEHGGSALARTASLMRVFALMEEFREPARSYAPIPDEFQAVLDDVNERCCSIKRIEDVCRQHYISRATLNRYFQRYIRSSPREYLLSLKLSCAAKLLLTGRSVTEACMSAGFSDCSRFIVTFKKRFGDTPAQYKKRFLR